MHQEKSCGAVVYTVTEGRREYLIEQMKSGNWGLPKGHMESGETEEQTALREILEETGLSVSLDTRFREVEFYMPLPRIHKEVVFFTAYSPTKAVIPQPSEITEICWLPYSAAAEKLTHISAQYILQKAEAYLDTLQKGNNNETTSDRI